MNVSVVIINWNGGGFIKNCIESVWNQSFVSREIVVIDNDSIDDSKEYLSEQENIKAFFNSSNKGFSAACNQGIRACGSKFVLIMNSDVVLERKYLEGVLQPMALGKRIGMVTGKVLRFDRKTIDTCGQMLGINRRAYERGYGEWDRNQFGQKEEVFSVCGAVALYRREMLDDVSVGGEYFDEDFFAFYEDIDLGWRARNKGWKAYFTPKAVAYHYRGGTNTPKPVNGYFWNRYELMRRPKEIQAHIVINRYLMMIKNDHIFKILKNFPFILTYEVFLWGYIFLFRPLLILEVLKKLNLLGKAFRKRSLMKREKDLPLAWN